jgi:hypothetical protein
MQQYLKMKTATVTLIIDPLLAVEHSIALIGWLMSTGNHRYQKSVNVIVNPISAGALAIKVYGVVTLLGVLQGSVIVGKLLTTSHAIHLIGYQGLLVILRNILTSTPPEV